MITLIPVAMVCFNDQEIYAPSRLKRCKQVTYQKFLKRYADHPINLFVSFEKDGFSNPQKITVFSFGLDGTWMIGE